MNYYVSKKKISLKINLLKNILSFLAVPVFGFVLLNAAFLTDFFFQITIDKIISNFIPLDLNRAWNWYPLTKHLLFVFIVGFISRQIFKSKMRPVFKAIYLTLPFTVIYVTLGILFYRWPIVGFSLALYFFLGTLYFLKKKKLHWLYYWSLILVSLALFVSSLTGTQI